MPIKIFFEYLLGNLTVSGSRILRTDCGVRGSGNKKTVFFFLTAAASKAPAPAAAATAATEETTVARGGSTEKEKHQQNNSRNCQQQLAQEQQEQEQHRKGSRTSCNKQPERPLSSDIGILPLYTTPPDDADREATRWILIDGWMGWKGGLMIDGPH